MPARPTKVTDASKPCQEDPLTHERRPPPASIGTFFIYVGWFFIYTVMPA
jgi:hypothetical protein